jgi:5'-3' exonuclease
MGVPAFFRWLTIRYPKVVIDALTEDDLEILADTFATEQKKTKTDPNEIDLDEEDQDLKIASTMNKQRSDMEEKKNKVKENNPQVDNLYLDMNGIIHPCAHP